MACEVQCRGGNHIYIYESVSYRNEDGHPRNSRVLIGKIDPGSGEKIYKPEYIARMETAGTPVVISQKQLQFSIEDVKNSMVLEYGLTHVLGNIAEHSGLAASLETACPAHSDQIYALASHLVATGDPFMHCQDWLEGTANMENTGNLSSPRISELLAEISFEEREEFYRQWCAKLTEKEYLALDITSTSSYSTLIDDVEWGYNRDGEDLAQVNLCMLMGEKSRLPAYQTVYSGSLRDVSTLQTTLAKFKAVAGEKPILSVMDKGFCSKKNIDDLLEKDHKFVMAVPFSLAFAQQQVLDERAAIDTLQNTILMGGDSLRAVTRKVDWNGGNEVFAHIFFNPIKAANDREKLYAKVADMYQTARKAPRKYAENPDYLKYLNICRQDIFSFTVEIMENAVNDSLKHAGWLVIISNEISNCKHALRIYRSKDVVEKGFMRLKNSLDLGRLRVHSDKAMQNKVFIGFVALILLSKIHNVMLDKNLYKKWTMTSLIRTLAKHRVNYIKGLKVLFPTTKGQRFIYEAFGISAIGV